MGKLSGSKFQSPPSRMGRLPSGNRAHNFKQDLTIQFGSLLVGGVITIHVINMQPSLVGEK
eukprot:5079242-Amphidinium_carterae.1